MMLGSKHTFLVNMYYIARFIGSEHSQSANLLLWKLAVVLKYESSVLADTDANALFGMVPQKICSLPAHFRLFISFVETMPDRQAFTLLATISLVFFSKQTFNLHENTSLKQ